MVREAVLILQLLRLHRETARGTQRTTSRSGRRSQLISQGRVHGQHHAPNCEGYAVTRVTSSNVPNHLRLWPRVQDHEAFA